MAAPALLADSLSSFDLAKRFLRRFPTVQVDFWSSVGNGHRAAGLDVLETMEHLGYRGRLQGRIATLSSEDSSRLATLAPELFDPHRVPPFRFVEESFATGDDESRDPVLKIMGAGPVSRPQGAISVFLQPPYWAKESPLVSFGNAAAVDPELERFLNYGIYVKDRSVPEIIAYSKKYRPEIAGNIEYLLNSRANVAWMPVYGVGVEGTEKLARLIVSLHKIRGELRQRGFTGAPVIVLESRVNDFEMAAVYRLVDQYSSELGSEIHLWKVDGSEPQLQQIQRDVSDTTVVLARFGTVPQNIFKGLMQWSPLPVVVAGTGALNQARYLGRPYLVTSGQSHGTQDNFQSHREFMSMGGTLADDEVVQGLEISEKAFQILSAKSSLSAHELAPISQFILDSIDSNSTLSRAIQRASAAYRVKDQFIEVLAEAERSISAAIETHVKASAKVRPSFIIDGGFGMILRKELARRERWSFKAKWRNLRDYLNNLGNCSSILGALSSPGSEI